MRKSYLIGLAVSAAIMVLLPWLTVTFVKGDAAMRCVFSCFSESIPFSPLPWGYLLGRG